MPMFLDVHRRVEGATEADIADAHRADRERQAPLDVEFRGYWFAPRTGTLFCLAEGRDPESVAAVHRASHGLVADEVFEVVGATEPSGRSGRQLQ